MLYIYSNDKATIKKKIVFIVFLLLNIVFFVNFNRCFADNKPLIVGIDVNFPPMGFINEQGEIVGADIDFVKLALQSIGEEVKVQPINWDSKELELNSRNIDLICNGLSYTPERDKTMTLTQPYMENRQVTIVRADSGIEKLNQLCKKTVCVQKGSSGEIAFEKSEFLNSVDSLIKLENCVDCLNELQQKKVDAVVVDEAVASYYMNLNGLNNEFKILNEVLSSEFYVIAVKKGNVALKDKIEQAYKNVVNTPQAEQISKKWFGKLNVLQLGNLKIDDLDSENIDQTDVFKTLGSGLLVSLSLFAFCLAFSVPLGLILTYIRNLKLSFLNHIINFYIAIMRGTPLLLQLFFAFYGLPLLMPFLVLKQRFLVGVVVFILNYTAYFTEIFRGGLNAISKGQFEAIEILGISKIVAVFKIIIPQMLKVCLPSICNETISLIKDTALIFSIGVIELLTATKNLVNATANVVYYIVVAAIYFVLCSLINLIFKLFEKKFQF